LNLPDRDGLDVLAELRERHPAISAVVLSASDDRDTVAKALDLGALGSFPNRRRARSCSAPCVWFFRRHLYPREILARRERRRRNRFQRQRIEPRPSRPAISALTTSGGRSRVDDAGQEHKAICRALDLAEPTVNNHVTAILKALK